MSVMSEIIDTAPDGNVTIFAVTGDVTDNIGI